MSDQENFSTNFSLFQNRNSRKFTAQNFADLRKFIQLYFSKKRFGQNKI